MAVRCYFRFAYILYLSIRRVGDPGGIGSFFVQGMVLGYIGTDRYGGIPWLRARWQVVIALSIPCNPPRLGIVEEFVKSLWLAGRPVPRDLPVHLKLSSNSNYITCMIINCSLHGYI